MPLDDETSYRLLKLLSDRPDMSQREIAREAGISLGKINYCLRAFMDRGWLKVNSFAQNRNKQAYVYYLTPKGAQEKALITMRFLNQKMEEYEAIKDEIAQLQREASMARHADCVLATEIMDPSTPVSPNDL